MRTPPPRSPISAMSCSTPTNSSTLTDNMNSSFPPISRRRFIGTSLAAAAFMPSLTVAGGEPHSQLSPKLPMLPPKAKSIILLVTQGGMSQMDTFDPKPELDKYDGKKLTPEILPGIGEV